MPFEATIQFSASVLAQACKLIVNKYSIQLGSKMDDPKPAQTWLPEMFRVSAIKKDCADASSPNETTNLLSKPSSGPDRTGTCQPDESYDAKGSQKSTTSLVVNEFICLLKGSIPVILAYALQNSLQTLSVVVVGRGSPEDLATAAFSYMFAMATAWLIALGGSTALDTLCAVAYTGSHDPHDLGVFLQRAFIVLGLFYIPICALWIFSEPLFLALGQSPQIARDSAKFLRCLVPGGLGYIYFEALKKFLQAQGTIPQASLLWLLM